MNNDIQRLVFITILSIDMLTGNENSKEHRT